MATFGSKLDTGFVWAAVGALVLLVLVGIAYDGKPTHRHLYARELAGVRELRGKTARRERAARSVAPAADDLPSVTAWYKTMIEREQALIGGPAFDNSYHWPWFHVKTLHEGIDAERTSLRAVQALWLAVIVLLILAVVG